jgi:Ser/Thr protein kinase RdoA (MazF antagonist)
VLLFEEAPSGEFAAGDEEACRQLGIAVAELHDAGDRVGPGSDALWGSEDLVPYVRRLAYEADFEELEGYRVRLEELMLVVDGDQENPDVGWCHGDLVLSNMRRRKDGSIVFFDFGNAAFVSRAWELARVRRTIRADVATGQFDELWGAFLSGYAQIRRLPAASRAGDRLAILDTLQRIRWIGGVMASCPLRMGAETFNRDWVRTRLQGVRESVDKIERGQKGSQAGELRGR